MPNYLRYINPFQLKIIVLLILFLVISIFLGLIIGSFEISLLKLFKGDLDDLENEIFTKIRSPRIVLCAFVGAALGISGASLQGLFRNPLADPGLIGVSAGAALGAVTSIVVFSKLFDSTPFGVYLLPMSAIFGAFVVIFLLYSLSRGFRYEGITYMLLIGIAINALATVGIGVLTFISDNTQLRGLTFWMMGSFGNSQWQIVIPSIIIILLSIIWLIPVSRKIDIIQIGEIEATRLGVDVKSLKIRIILSSAIMVGVSVSVSGMVGFVGLVVPHLVRLIGGVSHNFLLIGSTLLGSGLVVLSDILSRTLIQPAELPIGLVTSAIGSPFFLWLIIRIQKL